MSERVRVLPEWLVSLGSEEVIANNKTDASRKRKNDAQKKNASVNDSNDNYSSGNESDSLMCCNSVEENEENTKPCGSKNSQKLFTPIKLVNRKGTMPEISDSEDEVSEKSDFLGGNIKEKHEQVLPSYVKGENENSDETEDELDLMADTVDKSRNVEEQVCVDKTLSDSVPCSDINVAVNPSVAPVNETSIDNNDIGTESNNVNENDIDQQSTRSTSINATQIVRPKCKYGTQCYRKNPQHRRDFSHPEDHDYTTVDNRPECEYGLGCYRKNPLHRQHYKHTQKVQKPRQAKRPRKKLANDLSNDEDDYDLDDPFIDDASSDDYEPSASDSETDLEADEAEVNSDDESKLPVKETQELKRKREH